MKVGYLHLGPERNGVTRYGRLLAAEARRRPAIDLIEHSIELTGAHGIDRCRIREAGRHLADSDVVHIQYSHLPQGSIWGAGWSRMRLLTAFARAVARPLVVTVHDLGQPGTSAFARWSAHALALRAGARLARTCLVSSTAERDRLGMWAPHARVRVIHHLVEHRDASDEESARHDARYALRLDGRRVVTLLGFIHRRKGYRLLLEAASLLPPDVTVVLAGEPVGDAAARDMAAVQGNGRVRVTGYLPENELSAYISATDVAVCPFEHMAASGSLSTWISSGRPIVASDLPQVADYNAMARGAIEVFSPYAPEALAASIRAVFARNTGRQLNALAQLRQSLSAARIFDAHLDVYAQHAACRTAALRAAHAAAG